MLSSHFIPFCSILSVFPLLAASLPLLKGPNNLVCPKPSGLSFALQTVPRIKCNRSQSLQCQGPGTSIRVLGSPASYYQMHRTLEAASGHPCFVRFLFPRFFFFPSPYALCSVDSITQLLDTVPTVTTHFLSLA